MDNEGTAGLGQAAGFCLRLQRGRDRGRGGDEVTAEVVPYEGAAPVTLFGTDDPSDIIKIATEKAEVLARVIRSRKLASIISGREYVRLEGWTLLGTMLGVFPICVWSRQIENGWEGRAEARTLR